MGTDHGFNARKPSNDVSKTVVCPQFPDSYTVAGNKIDIGASVGIALNEGAVSAQELIDRADRSMYKAKRQN